MQGSTKWPNANSLRKWSAAILRQQCSSHSAIVPHLTNQTGARMGNCCQCHERGFSFILYAYVQSIFWLVYQEKTFTLDESKHKWFYRDYYSCLLVEVHARSHKYSIHHFVPPAAQALLSQLFDLYTTQVSESALCKGSVVRSCY